MILTYKIKHNRDFSRELELAQKVAEFAIENRDKLSSKYVSHIGLKSTIACQILRKYGRNKKVKTVSSVKLIIPNQSIKLDNGIIYISSLQLTMPFDRVCEKINQIEIDDVYAYVSVTVKEEIPYVPEVSIGIDLNTTSHCAVVAIKEKSTSWERKPITFIENIVVRGSVCRRKDCIKSLRKSSIVSKTRSKI